MFIYKLQSCLQVSINLLRSTSIQILANSKYKLELKLDSLKWTNIKFNHLWLKKKNFKKSIGSTIFFLNQRKECSGRLSSRPFFFWLFDYQLSLNFYPQNGKYNEKKNHTNYINKKLSRTPIPQLHACIQCNLKV